METRTLIASLAALAVIPATVGAAIQLDQTAGSLAGSGTTPTHDFEVNATAFDLEISDPDAEGFRAVTVTVPVLAIDTNNAKRNSHMRNTIFEGFEQAGKDLVVFNARTDSAFEPGPITLNGRLSLLGQGRPVTVTADITGTDTLTATGSATIDLSLWNIDMPGMGPMKVSEQVQMGFKVDLPAQDTAGVSAL